MNQRLHEACQSIWRLLSSWYRVDQIRVSSSQERWLDISCGTRLLVRGTLFAVVSRDTRSGEISVCVDYRLSSDAGSARLRVSLTQLGTKWQTTAELLQDDLTERLLDDDVTILKTACVRNNSRTEVVP
ncbi:MAG: hypothetical protein R3C19_06855 [Planctomycetaceae bacterium]